MPGLTTGLLSGGINKAISGSGALGVLYLHKHDKCYRVQKCKGNGLYLAPLPRFVEGDGLFLKHGNDISNGAGLLMDRVARLRKFPFWDGYCNYLKEMYTKQNAVFLLSDWYS